MAGENNHFYGGQSEETLKQIGKKQKKNWEDPKHIYNSKEFRKNAKGCKEMVGVLRK